MLKYRKKPVTIEAVQWRGENDKEIKDFVGENLKIELVREPEMTSSGFIPKWVELTIKTLAGDMKISVGDYVIRGVKGEFYPCTADIFQATYEQIK